MRNILILAALLAPAMLTTGATGAGCQTAAQALGRIEIGGTSEDATWYVDHRGMSATDTWFYQESNGYFVGGNVAADLQRGDTNGLYTDPCVDNQTINPDTLLL